MSESTEKLQIRLEQATAAADAPVGDLDAETSAMRDAWLQFGALLQRHEQTTTEANPQATVEFNLASLPAESTFRAEPAVEQVIRPQVAPTETLAGARATWRYLAIAASLLAIVAGAMTWRAYLASREQQVAVHNGSVEPAPNHAIPGQHSATETIPRITGSQAGGSEWSDSLDDEIAAVRQSTLYAEQGWYTQPGLGSVETGISELEHDMRQTDL